LVSSLGRSVDGSTYLPSVDPAAAPKRYRHHLADCGEA